MNLGEKPPVLESKVAKPGETESASVVCSTEDLVRRTISDAGPMGLPERSKVRIKRGMEKLKAEPMITPRGGTPVDQDRRGKGAALALAGAASALLFLPLWVLPAVVLSALILGMVFVGCVGMERIGGWVTRWYAGLAEKDPARAERMRQRAAQGSAILTAITARLPDRWVRGLYLPDFEPAPEAPEKMKSDPFERLSV